MRIRTTKPAFFKSVDIAELQIPTRLHFIGVWSYVDDEGRGLDDPRLLKAELWPLDDKITTKSIERMQDELAGHGRIVRYCADGRSYFEVVNWHQHQKINKPQASRIPPPPFPTDSGNVPGTGTEDSRLEGKGKDRKGTIAPTERRDELFEVVAEVCDIDWHELTDSARGSLNKAVAQLRALHPDPDEVRRRAANWTYETRLTPPALAKHWPELSKRFAPKASSNGHGEDLPSPKVVFG